MKKLLLTLLLSLPVQSQTVSPAPTPAPAESPAVGLDLTPQPAPAVIDISGSFKLPLFASHIEAEQNYYHCALGIDIWGRMIQGFIPEFEPVNVSSVISPVNPFICSGFEIYPDSQLCSNFPDQDTAEANFSACKLTNFQYWDALGRLLEVTKPTPPSQCKRFGGQNVYKAKSNTRDSAVLVMSQAQYCMATEKRNYPFRLFDDRSIQNDMRPLNIYLNDIHGNRISNGSFRHCNKENGGRLHYDFPRGSGEAVIEILFEERTECFYVPDRSRDQR